MTLFSYILAPLIYLYFAVARWFRPRRSSVQVLRLGLGHEVLCSHDFNTGRKDGFTRLGLGFEVLCDRNLP